MTVKSFTRSTITTDYKYQDFLAGNPAVQYGSFYLIQQLSPSAVSTVTFSSIPSTYKSLQVRYNLILSSANSNIELQFNGDTSSANYAMHLLDGTGTAAQASGVASGSNNYIALTNNQTVNTYPNVGIIDSIDYSNTSKNKTVKTLFGGNQNTSIGYVGLTSGLWLSTAAITSLTILNAPGTFTGTISLYGVN